MELHLVTDWAKFDGSTANKAAFSVQIRSLSVSLYNRQT